MFNKCKVRWSSVLLLCIVHPITAENCSISVSPLRWEFVGCGRITLNFAAAVESQPRSEHGLQGSATRNANEAGEHKSVVGDAKAYGSHKGLTKDADVGTTPPPISTTTFTSVPATSTIPQGFLGCFDGNDFYALDVQVQRNCHICACVPTVIDDEEYFQFLCDTRICLLQEENIRTINENPAKFPWKASNYSFFWGLTLDEGIRHRLGTFRPDENVARMTEIPTPQFTSSLSESFDARLRWPGLIHPVRDQGNCAASWAFSTTALVADRIAIMSQGERNFSLSPQHMMSCSSNPQKGCSGGSIDRAWVTFRIKGVVAEECYPFEGASGTGKCFPWTPNGISKCPNGTSTERRLYRTEPPYRIASKENAIMYEILTHGPVQAVFPVYPDFFMYRTGIYRTGLRDPITGIAFPPNPLAYHSVRIIGWGVDHSYGQPIKYWICANSWGAQWGEDGTFRIVRGENESQIESFVVGVVGRGYRTTAAASLHIPASPPEEYNTTLRSAASAVQSTTRAFRTEKATVTESPLFTAIRSSVNTTSETSAVTTESGATSTKRLWWEDPDWY